MFEAKKQREREGDVVFSIKTGDRIVPAYKISNRIVPAYYISRPCQHINFKYRANILKLYRAYKHIKFQAKRTKEAHCSEYPLLSRLKIPEEIFAEIANIPRLKILGEIFAEIANMSGSSGGCWFLAVVVGKKTLDTMARDTSNFPQGEIVKKEHTRNMKMPIAESAICVRL